MQYVCTYIHTYTHIYHIHALIISTDTLQDTQHNKMTAKRLTGGNEADMLKNTVLCSKQAA